MDDFKIFLLEKVHQLESEKKTLCKAVKFAAEAFENISSADGSGHADLALVLLRIAGSAMSKESSHE